MRLGLDYGGTKIEGIVLGPDGAERARARVPTPRFDYDGGIRAIRGLLERLEAEAGGRIERVGIGVPGSVDRATGRVSMGNSTWLHGRDLRGDLAAVLDRPVRVANDANCFALSEAVDGAGAGAQVVFGVILGTGVGGGIAIGGHALSGRHRIAGEWGHNPLPWPHDDERPGPDCYCGRKGCIETFLSGPGLAADFFRATGERIGADEIVRRRDAGDAEARACLERYHDRLARALATVINLVDPDAIVLGGGLSNVDELYQQVPSMWTPYVFSGDIRTRLCRAELGDSAGVFGAAWLW